MSTAMAGVAEAVSLPRVQRSEDVGGRPTAARVFAVDARPVMRSGLARTARRALGGGALPLTDLAQASAARVLTDSSPEALLLGLRSGDDPAALISGARRIAPIVIAVLDADDPVLVRAALAAGADAYMVTEDVAPDALRETLAAVRGGGPTVPDQLRRAPGGGSGGTITDRCREVLVSLADGLHDHEIADRLGISTSSVRKHVANAQERLEARTRTEAVARAARAGLL